MSFPVVSIYRKGHHRVSYPILLTGPELEVVSFFSSGSMFLKNSHLA